MAIDPALRRRLEGAGPLSVATLFEAAGASDAYYERPEVIGGAGDFVTAPEISQCFGELLAVWLVDAWQRQGAPAPFVLAELGPGRGTLMRDAWRALGALPAARDAARLHLVERSRRLRALQARALAAAEPRFHDVVADLPPGPLFLIANEFLDALPVHQLVCTADGWRERCVGLEAGVAGWTTAPAEPALVAAATAAYPHAPQGAIAEFAPARAAVVAEIATRVTRDGGAALFVDYGGDPTVPVDTLQAVRNHRPVPVLDHLGVADITTAVAFAPLRDAAESAGALAYGPLPQATVLRGLGIELRAMQLATGKPRASRAAIMSGVRRLLDPRAMGEAFKMLAVLPRTAPPPAGFTDSGASP